MFERAIELFSAIVQQQPDWEHGICYYELGICYEELENLKEAERCFRKALSYDPNYYLYLAALASFLYLHGDSREAFNAHLDLIKIDARNRDQRGMEKAQVALRALGKKLGMADEEVLENIRRVINQGERH